MREGIVSHLKAGLGAEGRKRQYYVLFTVCFLVTGFFVLSWYFFTGHSLIYEHDGMWQYYRAHVYYGQYLRKVVRTLFSGGGLVFPAWDFALGEGGDIVNTLHYYVMGDPIALLTVFVPTRFMHAFYTFSIVLRLYLAGVSFSALCFGLGIGNRYGILSSALSYSFCAWAIWYAARHFLFLNPLILLPLVILGIEKVCTGRRPTLYIAAIAVTAASSFYYFYVIAILVAVFAALRVFLGREKHTVGRAFGLLFTLLGYSVLGACMAGVVFYPIVISAIQDARLSVDYGGNMFYSLNYYGNLPKVAVSAVPSDNFLSVGMTAPAVYAAVLLFSRRGKDRLLKVLFLLCGLAVLLPFAGRLFNGLSYQSNRWSFSLALLFFAVTAKYWEDLMRADGRQKRLLFAVSAGWLLLGILIKQSRTVNTFPMVALQFVLWIILDRVPEQRRGLHRQAAVLLLVAVNIVMMAFLRYSPNTGDLVSDSADLDRIDEILLDTEAARIKKIAGEAYPRYTGRGLTGNAGLTEGVSSTQYYWSLSNPAVSRYQTEMELAEMRYQEYEGYDDRAALIALSGAQYYVTAAEDPPRLPYGFEAVDTMEARGGVYGETLICKSPYTLPFGYCYDAVIPEEQWDAMNAVQKQQVQLNAAYVGAEQTALPAADAPRTTYEIPYEITFDESRATYRDGRFVVTADSATAKLTFESPADAETYVELTGLDYKKTKMYDLYFGDASVDPDNLYNEAVWDLLSEAERDAIRQERLRWTEKTRVTLQFSASSGTGASLLFLNGYDKFTSGRHNFIVNLGYQKEPVTSVVITFPERGIYTLPGLHIYSVPMEELRTAVPERQETALRDVTFDTDAVRGTITADRPQILCAAIPWHNGWSAFTDGEAVPVLCVNGHYLGVALQPGTHTVEFRYRSPGRMTGLCLTAAGLACFAALTVLQARKRKRLPADTAAQKQGEDRP